MHRNPRTAFSRLAAAAALVSIVAGCSPTEPLLLEDDPVSIGPVVAVGPEFSSSGEDPAIHVRPEGDQCGVYFTILPETLIKRRDDGAFVDVPVDALAVGDSVAVWTDSPILLSCPGQGGASAIQVLTAASSG